MHLAAMEAAAREAGKLICQHLGNVSQTVKDDMTLVTLIDSECEEAIKTQLASFGYGFSGEEGGRSGNHAYTWIVDPIDGTSNFSAGIPMCCVSIALEHDGDLVAGIVYDPSHDELFAAQRGKGATLNGRPIERTPTKKSMLLMDTMYSEVGEDFYRALHAVTRVGPMSVRSLGSAALAIAYVAAGRADIFLGKHQKPWDVAAGIVLCREMGLAVTDWAGKPASHNGQDWLIGSEDLHAKFVDALNGR